MRFRALCTGLVVAVLAAPPMSVSAAAHASTPVRSAGPSAAARSAVAPGTFSTAPRLVRRNVSAPQVTAIRVAHHPTFDRIVVQLRGRAPGFDVRYVPQLHADGSGDVVDLLGPASLEVVLAPANAHNPNTGRSSLTTPARTTWRLDQVRETAVIGDFEAVVTLGVGLRRRAPFRVLTLTNPTRIALDVRH